jgi:hypothetical protein
VIDDVRIYDTVLTDDNILSIFRCGADTAPYLVGLSTVPTKALYLSAGSLDYASYDLPFQWTTPFELPDYNHGIIGSFSSELAHVCIIAKGATATIYMDVPPAGTADGLYTATFSGINSFGESLNCTLNVNIITGCT